MTLMGVPTADMTAFSVGTTNTGDSMEKSLEDMIKERRKEQQKLTRKPPKKSGVANRSIATGKAKREAAVKAKRGIAQSTKPSKKDVKMEIMRQEKKTAKAKQAKLKKDSGGRIRAPAGTRKNKTQQADVVFARTPSKKAIQAAATAMEQAGYKVPDGMQIVVSVMPKDIGGQTKKQQQQQQQQQQNQTRQTPKNAKKGNANSGRQQQQQQQQQQKQNGNKSAGPAKGNKKNGKK